VRAGQDIGHDAVEIHWVPSKPETYPPRVTRTAQFEVRDLLGRLGWQSGLNLPR
jgi:hypothetical protein